MTEAKGNRKHPGSFRDPSGFIFFREGAIYRQVNLSYRADFEHLIDSGLYGELVSAGLLVAHETAKAESPDPANCHTVIRPEPIPFVSYPYEWSFSEFKEAALATLDIQKRALRSGMSLKDASAYNVQFRNGRPMLIDTLSFERHREGEPWVAYRQFCAHFLSPLALMSKVDVRLGGLLRANLDGIPLDLAAKLLPGRLRFRPSYAVHIFLHAHAQRRFAGRPAERKGRKLGRMGLAGLIDNLESMVRRMSWHPAGTEWAEYYDDTNYSVDALAHKEEMVDGMLAQLNPKTVWDLGANDGRFSRLAARRGAMTVSFDLDPAAVEKNYLRLRRNREENILPLVLDLANPSPASGWDLAERDSLLERGPADAVLALALIHHLAISNNLPFAEIARFLARAGRNLIIEFVPKDDSNARRLLASRRDIFSGYTRERFEQDFGDHFRIEQAVPLRGSERIIYLMRARDDR